MRRRTLRGVADVLLSPRGHHITYVGVNMAPSPQAVNLFSAFFCDPFSNRTSVDYNHKSALWITPVGTSIADHETRTCFEDLGSNQEIPAMKSTFQQPRTFGLAGRSKVEYGGL